MIELSGVQLVAHIGEEEVLRRAGLFGGLGARPMAVDPAQHDEPDEAEAEHRREADADEREDGRRDRGEVGADISRGPVQGVAGRPAERIEHFHAVVEMAVDTWGFQSEIRRRRCSSDACRWDASG